MPSLTDLERGQPSRGLTQIGSFFTPSTRLNDMASKKPPIDSLAQYLEASKEKYDACLDSITHDLKINDIQATLRFHFIRFDSNGDPKFKDLAECLADHIVGYCFCAARRKKSKRLDEITRLVREARHIFRKDDTGGEAGEMLLYFLLESVIGAPQVVAKMDLKTNQNLESNGSDGIHMRWDATKSRLEIYFGEAKLEDGISGAMTNALNSINNFHADNERLRDHEFGLVTSHFKWIDERLRKAVITYVDRQDPQSDCRVNHACLVGYDWPEYKKLSSIRRDEMAEEFKKRYSADLPRICELLERRLPQFKNKSLNYEMFFIPFQSVQEFRNAFNHAIG